MEKSSFFNAVLDQDNTPDRTYTAEDFARYFASFIGNGVFSGGNSQLEVIAKGNDMSVVINKGKAWINGYYYENTSDLKLHIDVADGTYSRIDTIVLRLDLNSRSINAKVKKGRVNSQTAPNITRNSDIYELALANVRISAGVTDINDSNIEDLRFDKTVCGFVKNVVEGYTDTASFDTVFAKTFKTSQSSNERIEICENGVLKFYGSEPNYPPTQISPNYDLGISIDGNVNFESNPTVGNSTILTQDNYKNYLDNIKVNTDLYNFQTSGKFFSISKNNKEIMSFERASNGRLIIHLDNYNYVSIAPNSCTWQTQ